MGTEGKSWHAAIDTPDQIKMCLSCKRPKCVDCIGRKLPAYKERYVGNSKIVKGKRLNETARKFIQIYRTAECDRDIAEKLGKSVSAITGIRIKLGLPPIREISDEERNRIVDDWIREGA